MRFLRTVRQKLLNTNKLGKYLLYALGEIILVVIGVVIALQLNEMKKNEEKGVTRDYYTNAILEDLKRDSIFIRNGLVSYQEQLDVLNNQVSRIFDSNATIDTIIHIARFEFDNTFYSIQYNDNSFKTVVSSGYTDLFDKGLIKKLMELDESHRAEISDTKPSSETYRTQLATYYRTYSPDYGMDQSNLIDSIIWTDIDEKDFVGKFRAMLFMKIFITNEFMSHLISIEKKTHNTITFIRKRKANKT